MWTMGAVGPCSCAPKDGDWKSTGEHRRAVSPRQSNPAAEAGAAEEKRPSANLPTAEEGKDSHLSSRKQQQGQSRQNDAREMGGA